MRALLLLALVGAAVAAAATTTIEPDRPVWPQEYQVRGGPCCRRRHPPAARGAGAAWPFCGASGHPASPLPACFAVVQVSWEFEVPYIKEYQKEGLT